MVTVCKSVSLCSRIAPEQITRQTPLPGVGWLQVHSQRSGRQRWFTRDQSIRKRFVRPDAIIIDDRNGGGARIGDDAASHTKQRDGESFVTFGQEVVVDENQNRFTGVGGIEIQR